MIVLAMKALLGTVIEIIFGKNKRYGKSDDVQYHIFGSGGLMGYATDYLCPAGTVIVGRKGTINCPLFVDEPFWNVDTAFGLVANKEVLSPRYLYHFCKQYDFMKLNTAATIPSLTKKNIQGIQMPLPGITEQQKICLQLDYSSSNKRRWLCPKPARRTGQIGICRAAVNREARAAQG